MDRAKPIAVQYHRNLDVDARQAIKSRCLHVGSCGIDCPVPQAIRRRADFIAEGDVRKDIARSIVERHRSNIRIDAQRPKYLTCERSIERLQRRTRIFAHRRHQSQ
ncbi:MAG: hypothetical protein ACLPZ0_03975 [Steroidobacteraceae bacterium]